MPAASSSSSHKARVQDNNTSPSLSDLCIEMNTLADGLDGDYESLEAELAEISDMASEINAVRMDKLNAIHTTYMQAVHQRDTLKASNLEGATTLEMERVKVRKLEEMKQQILDEQYDLQVEITKQSVRRDQHHEMVEQLTKQFKELRVKHEEEINMYTYIRRFLVLISSIRLYPQSKADESRNVIRGFVAKTLDVEGDDQVIPFTCDLNDDPLVYVNDVWAKIQEKPATDET